jgi:hypothetical protein
MIADLSRFKVIHGERVLNAVALSDIIYSDDQYPTKSSPTICKALFLVVLAINTDGHIIAIHDEAWRFQFLPITSKED